MNMDRNYLRLKGTLSTSAAQLHENKLRAERERVGESEWQ